MDVFSLDLTDERCVFWCPGQQYIITRAMGHHYAGPPVIIMRYALGLRFEVDGHPFKMGANMGTYTFSKNPANPDKSVSSLDFVSRFYAGSAQPVEYHFSTAEAVHPVLR